MRRRNAMILVLVVVAVLAVWVYHRHSLGGQANRSAENTGVAPEPPKKETWTKIYTICEGEGREYIESEIWQDGKKLDQMTPMDRADLGPDHQIKVRIVPPPGLEPKNFSRDSEVLIKEGDSFIGELDCKYRMRFSGSFYDGFRVFDGSDNEMGGCIYGDNSTYDERIHRTDSSYCQVFLPGPGKYRVVMINGGDCMKRCATASRTIELTEDQPRINLTIPPPPGF